MTQPQGYGQPQGYPGQPQQPQGDPFVPAPEAGGFKPTDFVGGLAAMRVHQFVPNAQTPNGIKDACLVDFACIQNQLKPELVGTGYMMVKVYNPGIVDRIRPSVGQIVIGRLITVPSTRSGGNPAVIFSAPDEADLTYARQVWQQGDPFANLKPPPPSQHAPQTPQGGVPGFPSTYPQNQSQQGPQGGYGPQGQQLPPVPDAWQPQTPPPGAPAPPNPWAGQSDQPPY